MACTKFTDVTEVSKAEDLNRSSEHRAEIVGAEPGREHAL
jgi:hypothetical protein